MINTRYEIIKKLGQGRSSVYLCRDIEFPGEEYAIKILPPDIDDNEKEIFIKEYFTLLKLEHPNIIKAFDLGTVFTADGEEGINPGSSFIILEYFEGEELLSAKLIHNERNLREIVKQICASLYYLHQSKYIYYDLKPENILVSFKENNLQIRLIDLGLAEYSPSTANYEIKGTAYYIAPELLKKERHNHSVDFYSLGVILYRIVYERFPFEAKSELDIYKSALEVEFEFPPTDNFSNEFIGIVKKLLKKNVDERYSSALAIINDLGFNLDITIAKEFLPAKVYSCRQPVIDQISGFINDKDSSEVYSIRGFEGVGKTLLLYKLLEIYNHAIIISDVKGKPVAELIRYMLRQIIFSESVYPNLSESEKQYLLQLLIKSGREILNEFRQVIALLASKNKFILLIDDFNLYDHLASDFLLEIIPLLQVNNVKVVVSESSEHSFSSSRLSNVKEITLGPFTEKELKCFLEESFSSDFPINDLKDLIVANADLIPGNIKSFIKDLILFGIMKFSKDGVMISDEERKLSSLSEAQSNLYNLRIAKLSRGELIAARIISTFNIFIDSNSLSVILGLSKSSVEKIVYKLQFNNILQRFASGHTLIFTSEAIKKFIYASIENKKMLHRKIADRISKEFSSFNWIELARHYELAGEFDTCFKISLEEIKGAEKQSAFAYIQRILNHLVELPLKQELLDSVKVKLSEIYLKLGDVQSSLNTIKEIKNTLPPTKIDKRLFITEGSALIASGEYEAGKRVITKLLEEIDDVDEINRLKVELAYADFELKNYEEANKQSDLLLEEKNLSAELKGRCYNLKGMLSIYQNNDLNSALENFMNAKTNFKKANQPARVAGAEVNIGNIFSILKDYAKAERHWENASKINQSIGNLDQEGLLQQSLGVFYFDRTNFDLAIKSYLKAQNIFRSLGKEMYFGQSLWNLAEVFIECCEYQKAYDSLTKARKVFENLGNYEELSDVLFLMGKLFFRIGINQKLEEIILELKENNLKFEQKNEINVYELLLYQMIFFRKSVNISVEPLYQVCSEFYKLEDRNNYSQSVLLLIETLIKLNKLNEALVEINNPNFIDLCQQNSILGAEREYFLGIISKSYASDKLLAPLVHFERAYDLIKDKNILEITWKILYAISEIYIEKGNYNKAKQYVIYVRELIYFISEKLELPQFRAAYLRSSQRIETLKKLESFYPQE
ncbi:MAG: protein kinase [Ignavibacteriaceae bacterium]|nr:protein kinase [Ignavibacteriaceae bacterium]